MISTRTAVLLMILVAVIVAGCISFVVSWACKSSIKDIHVFRRTNEVDGWMNCRWDNNEEAEEFIGWNASTKLPTVAALSNITTIASTFKVCSDHISVKKFPYVSVLSNVCDSDGVPVEFAYLKARKTLLEKEDAK